MSLVYITCRDNSEAEKISRHLLERRLIACANIFPVKSLYWWDGRIVDENEVVIFAKAVDYEAVKEEVKKIHSYSVPCILKINTEANPEYMQWVKKVVGLK